LIYVSILGDDEALEHADSFFEKVGTSRS
jgi:hypothetical protein